MSQVEQDVVVTSDPGSRRILAFDLIRGFFLALILIDHIELYPSGWDLATGRGRLFVSAAEGFFLMSGLLVGLVYKRRLDRGFKFIFKKMWWRALELYVASVFFTLIYTAAAVLLNHSDIKAGLYSAINWPHIISETLLMRYGYGWADFLDRFALLMILAPFGFYLLAKRKTWLLIILSFVVWLLRGQGFTWSWQIIFFGGMAIGYHWYSLQSRWRKLAGSRRRKIKLWTSATAGVTFIVSYASVFLLSLLNEKWNGLSSGLQSFTSHWDSFNAWVWQFAQKWNVGPLRLVLVFLWFGALFMIVRRYEAKINRFTRGMLDLLGKNSLFVYVAQSVVVFGFKLFIPVQTTLWQNFLITTAALALLIAVAFVYRKILPPKPKQAVPGSRVSA